MENKIKLCSLCDKEAICKYEKMKGYIEGSSFDIYECVSCLASFVDPLKSDETIYNYIYKQADKIPGYARYYRYANLVTKVKNPLSVLADSENVYWGVREALINNFSNKESLKILEIGSGLGYLTYSLNKSGYSTTGLDLSKEAVEKAKNKYGNFYEAGDLFKIVENRKGQYDCVIMTEIIEHVENPKDFIKASLSLLKDGGKLILTTPNKNVSPKGIIWQSDVPPVHLWWLSEESIIKIAESFGKKCTFIDFTEYTKKYFEYGASSTMDEIQASLPRLDAKGNVLNPCTGSGIKSKILGVVLHTKISNFLRRIKSKTISSRSASMCVILS